MLNKFGGFVEGQYYFNNQWFVNALYAVSKAYNVIASRFTSGWLAQLGSADMEMAFTGDKPSTIQQIERDPVVPSHPGHQVRLAVFVCWRPATYFQMTTVPAGYA